jgi:hypothetical protein
MFNFFSKKTKNTFDDRFGFILKYKIDSKENYEKTKCHFFQYHQASE